MAKYRTDTTELTSIADAIRAKTGNNSSLVYPTGFVSAINGINANTLLYTKTIDEQTLTLADTDFANWDSSKSDSIIYQSTTLESFRRDMTDKTCMITCYGYIKYAYTTEIPNNGSIWCGYVSILQCSPRPDNSQSLLNKEDIYINSMGLAVNALLLYKSNQGYENSTNNAYGILLSDQRISTGSNSNPSNFQIVPKTPTIHIKPHATYSSVDSYSYIDPQNTIIYYKIIYEEYPNNQLYNKIYNLTSDLYIQSVSTT